MKKLTSIVIGISILLILALLLFKSCIIQNTEPEDCVILTTKIIELREYPSFDIGFIGGKGESFYINRGIESGINLDSLKIKVLNKTVTLHLPKMIFGPSKHIAQLALGDEIIYTEFD